MFKLILIQGVIGWSLHLLSLHLMSENSEVQLCTDCPTWESCVCMLSCFRHVFATHELYPDRLLCPWDFPGMNNGVGCRALLQWWESWGLVNFLFTFAYFLIFASSLYKTNLPWQNITFFFHFLSFWGGHCWKN